MEQANIRDAKFLIVDDELSNVRVLERMLEKWECFHVEITTNPHEVAVLFNVWCELIVEKVNVS